MATEKTINLNIWQSKLINTQTRFVCLLNEFGSGKTFAGSWKAHLLSMQHAKNNGAIIRNLHEDIRRNTAPLYCEYALQSTVDTLPTGFSYNKTIKSLTYPNGSVINFIALDRPDDTKKIKNDVFGWVWLEQAEELPEEVFQAVVRRVRLHQDSTLNKVFLTANAEEGSWIYDTFFADELNVMRDAIDTPYGKKNVAHGIWRGIDSDFMGIQAPPGANRPNLPDDYYESIIKTSSQDMVMRYVYNIPIGKSGKVYPFSEDNIVDNDYIDNMDFYDFDMFFEAQDYGISDTSPMVYLFGVKKHTGEIIIFDEYYEYEKGIYSCVDYVKSVRSILPQKAVFSVGCPRTFQREATSETRNDRTRRRPADLFAKEGVVLIPFPIHFDVRQPIVEKEMMNGNIKILRRCENLIKELRTRKWKDIPRKDVADHATEALERAVAKLASMSVHRKIDEYNAPSERKHRKATMPLTAGIMEQRF